MKKIFSILTICAAVFASCSKVEITTPGEAGLTVTLKMAGTDTKAVVPMPGVAELNENAVKAINYYIFDGASLVDSGSQTVADEMTTEGITVKLNGFTEEKFAEVFGADKKALSIYVVANATSQLSGKTIESVADIEAVALELATTAKQDNFVMVGNATIQEVDSDTDTRKATANVSLKRVVAKISLKIDLATSYQKAEGEPVWTPETSQISVSFSNLAKNGVIAGMADDVVLVNADVKNFTAAAEVGGYYPCTTAEPYYSYPRTWSLGDETQPYFLINIPWTANGETKQTYYKVILSNKSFASNNWYAIDVKLDGLGSLTPGVPVVVEPLDLTVADWTASVSGTYEYHTEASFTEARVLDIPQESIVLYNTTNLSVPYITSNDCVISNVKLQMYDYSQETISTSPVTLINQDNNSTSLTLSHASVSRLPDNDASFSLVDGKIIFSHSMSNSLSGTNFDFRDYHYIVTIKHSDSSQFVDQVEIIQKPALNIWGVRNSNTSNKNPNTFVNGYTSSNQSRGDNYKLVDISTGGNHNPNMYVIAASQLSSDVVIADPRSKTIDNLGSDWANNGNDITSSSTRTILYYYPTSNEKNIVAPKFRVASSYGKNGQSIDFKSAKERCASYQEDGYPAGRWRVPTKSEVEFIITLSAKGYIPTLFTVGSQSGYWCATGKITPVAGGAANYSESTSGDCFVRCVYDEWYWENTDYNRISGNINQFTWGDMER